MSDGFCETLGICMKYDKYLKVIDISNNLISSRAIKSIIKNSLSENTSLVTFDAKDNPGCTEKCKK